MKAKQSNFAQAGVSIFSHKERSMCGIACQAMEGRQKARPDKKTPALLG